MLVELSVVEEVDHLLMEVISAAFPLSRSLSDTRYLTIRSTPDVVATAEAACEWLPDRIARCCSQPFCRVDTTVPTTDQPRATRTTDEIGR